MPVQDYSLPRPLGKLRPHPGEQFQSTGAPADSVRAVTASRLRQRREQLRAAKIGTRISFLDWSLKVPEPKTGRLDFRSFPFQLEMYQEGADDPEAVWQKATQVGVSTILVRWLMYWPDLRGATGMYVMPKLNQATKFSDARIQAVINKSEYLSTRVPRGYVANKTLKQVGRGWLYIVGSESEDALDSVDADVLGLDEYNRLVPVNVPVAERRVSSPLSMGMIRRIGVPSIPNFGVSRHLAKSDWRRWHVKCAHCGEVQFLTWADNVDLERALRVCRSCRKELEADVIARGQWVATQHSDVRGYHLPKLVIPRLNLRPMIERSRSSLPEDVQAFWNRDNAEPYAPAEGRLDEDALAAAKSFGASIGAVANAGGHVGNDLITMGIDVASRRALNVRVSRHLNAGRKVSLFIGTVDTFDQLDRMMDAYGVHMAGIDHLPETRMAQNFAERHPGRVFLVNYAKREQQDVLKPDVLRYTASVRRTEAMDAVIQQVRELRNGLPERTPANYDQHMTTPTRVVERGPDGQVRVRYESPGADDYFHAEVYDLVASELWYLLRAVDQGGHTGISTLEDHMEYERSALHDETGLEYRGAEELMDQDWGGLEDYLPPD